MKTLVKPSGRKKKDISALQTTASPINREKREFSKS